MSRKFNTLPNIPKLGGDISKKLQSVSKFPLIKKSFFTFSIKTLSRKINKEKFVRNPKTNEKIYKNKSYKLHFKIGKILHKRINNLIDSNIEDVF